jgi:hypothetical protein
MIIITKHLQVYFTPCPVLPGPHVGKYGTPPKSWSLYANNSSIENPKLITKLLGVLSMMILIYVESKVFLFANSSARHKQKNQLLSKENLYIRRQIYTAQVISLSAPNTHDRPRAVEEGSFCNTLHETFYGCPRYPRYSGRESACRISTCIPFIPRFYRFFHVIVTSLPSQSFWPKLHERNKWWWK